MTGAGQVVSLPPGFEEFLERQRWFAGKGRPFRVTGARRLGRVREDPDVDVLLVDVDEDGRLSTYQVVLEHRSEPEERLTHVLVSEGADGPVYDALHDRDVTEVWPELIAADAVVDELGFHRIGDDQIPLDRPSLVMTAEQSNTSLVFGDAMILKVYRRVVPGVNPDVEVHRGLAAVGSEVVARPLGWVDCPDGTLAFLQEFLQGGAEGWELAKQSVRDLFVEADLHPEECGGDFAAEAERLGATTAELHGALRDAFPTTTLGPAELAARADRMAQRLDAAVAQVPELAPHAPGLRTVFEALGEIRHEFPAQRVHGDFHLGQTLRTTTGWKVLDFEGEPETPAAERRAPDTPMRDVAGMLRSLDYAAHSVLQDHPEDPQLAYRAAEWVEHNRAAYLRGYRAVAGDNVAEDGVLLRALETEKAVYEVVYESRMRPSWLGVPLAAVERLSG